MLFSEIPVRFYIALLSFVLIQLTNLFMAMKQEIMRWLFVLTLALNFIALFSIGEPSFVFGLYSALMIIF